MVRRELANVSPLIGIVRIPILGHPGCTRQKLVVSLHVQQGDLADSGFKKLWIKRDHVPDEQPTIGSTLDPKPLFACDPASDQVLGYRSKVLISPQTILLERRLMPPRSVLASTANVGDHIHSALSQPSSTDRCTVVRLKRNFESTVTIQQRWILSIEIHILLGDHEIRNLRPIAACRKVLTDLHPYRVKEMGQAFELLGHLANRSDRQRCRGQVVGRGHEIVIRIVGIDGRDIDGPKGWSSHQRLASPCGWTLGGRGCQDIKAILDILEHVDHNVILGRRDAR